MTSDDFDPLAQKARADALVEQAALRKEELKKLDDLHPRDYLVYAYSALTRVVEILLEQQQARGS